MSEFTESTIENTAGTSASSVVAPSAPPRRRPSAAYSEIPKPEDSSDGATQGWKLNWYTIVWLGSLHVLALLAFWTFTWQALVLTVFLHWLTGSVGVCLGYHRLLTHSSFQTHRWCRWVLATIGGLSGEGSAMDWVADHRKHHALSDRPGDPHSPNDGSWWSHMLWLGVTPQGRDRQKYFEHWVPDLAKDRGLQVLDRLFLPIQIAFGALVTFAGYLLGGSEMAVSFLIWGIFLRYVLVLHTTWFVNSASHMWGYRNYETTDQSRNNWWVAIIAYGEGWHNNHHAYPRMAAHGHKWWEIDMTYMIIRAMRATGLAWDVVDYRRRSEAMK